MRRLATAAFAGVVAYWFWRQWWVGSSRPDFEILIRASQRLSSGQAVYQLTDHAEHTKAPGLTWLMQGFLCIPEWMAKAFWDALSWGSLLWLGSLSRVGFAPGVLGWLLVAGPWWAEMRLGQYNLLLAALSLGVPLWEARAPSRVRGFVLGVVSVLVLLLKPTQLILIPFMLNAVIVGGRWKAALLGALAFGFFLMAGYSLQFGWQSWIAAHQEWVAFLPLSEAKHLLRSDNLGVTTQLARHLGAGAVISKAVLGIALTLAVVRVGYIDALLLSVVCSPMAWRQNFSPLFLMLSWSMIRAVGLDPMRKALFWACASGFGLLGADLLGAAGAEQFGRVGGPLLLVMLAWWAARPAARHALWDPAGNP